MKIYIDAGHGAINPMTGKYVTAGKRMVKDDIVYYEGVQNRLIADELINQLEDEGYTVVKIYSDWRDISLTQRVNHVNEFATKDDILISIHSDANGNGREWNSANGIGTWISKKASRRSEQLADSLNNSLICNYEGVAKNRGIKKANFAITTRTKCPAVLLELGFHTNKEEVKKMMTNHWRGLAVKSIIEAIEEYQLKVNL